ncbi:DNA glycosylase AlkZ-like family protein [Tenggerimyces flavus]|uniref:DNA glycosylase AlkZ-like family protein n=1 Tax=Tenggerimyces flavus TaxID=1708749 RepID=A0ABV7YQZ7_9ACTN|nr:crosslink repair DNA glycosylase YcaQ family protein [Tenggerimyces flavus]MBM7786405.1 uncharacterized protein YcaQ [Tenggerimyces flavus]
MTVHQLTRRDARRIAVQAQLLDAHRPSDLLETVRGLTFLRAEPTDAIAPSAHLVAWSRLGSSYDRRELDKAIEHGTLVDLQGHIRPGEDLALYRAEMADWPGRGELRDWQEYRRDWVAANDRCRQDILLELARNGPLPSKELPDTCAVPWESSGWNNDRNRRMLLDFMVERGEIAAAGWKGRDRLYDLAERIYPDDVIVPADEANRIRNEKRLRSLGIARAKATAIPGEPIDVGEIGEPAVVEGVRGKWRVDPSFLGQPFKGRAALLSPFDRLVHDRKRMAELFEFDYQLEMFKPAAKRRWGYFALPILYGDRLVGKLDAAADHKVGGLWVEQLHQDVPFTKAMTAAVEREIKDLSRWLAS